MEKKKMQFTVLVLFLLINISEGQVKTINTTQGTFRTDCFSESNKGSCKSSLITVGDNLYACGMMITAGPGLTVNRIGFIDGQILISRGDSDIYAIHKNGQLYPVHKILIPQSGNLVDQNNNVYFNADGTTYVGLNKTGEEVVIDTLGEKSFNQLALDAKSNTLYILAIKANRLYNSEYFRERGLYAVNTNPLNIHRRHIKAVLLTGIYNITALAIEPETQNLLIGMDTTQGNQFMRLIKLKENPCTRRSPLRYFLGRQLTKYSQNLEDMCRDAYYIVNKGGSPTQEEFTITYNKLVNEKIELKNKIQSLPKCANIAKRVSNIPENQTIPLTKQTYISQKIQASTSEIQTNSPNTQMTSTKVQTNTLETPPIDVQPADDAKSTCPPPSRKELENKNLTIEVNMITDRYNRLVEKLKTLDTKMDLEKDLLNEEETTTITESVYREPQKCLEVFEMEGLTNRVKKLEDVTKQLRTQLTEFIGKFKEIFRTREVGRKTG